MQIFLNNKNIYYLHVRNVLFANTEWLASFVNMGLTLQTTKGVSLQKKIRGCTLAVKKEIATLHLIVLAPLSYHS